MRKLLLFLSFITTSIIFGQNSDFNLVDQKMDSIPKNSTVSTQAIAHYISQNFTSEEEKIRATFYWIASNISYDVDIMFNLPQNQSQSDKIKLTLTTRKGVCMHYAEVFSSIANQLQIQTILVDGYTKNNDVIDLQSHVWCASKINNKWCLFDPTWGAGYVNNKVFFKKLNNFYFNTQPEKLILNHMPFDFIWQLNDYPINNQDFYDGLVSSQNTSIPFDYASEIEKHLKLSDIEKCFAFKERIQKSGLQNKLITDRLDLLNKEIDYHKQKKAGIEFSVIVENLNATGVLFNDFINYRNKRFNPPISDESLNEKTKNLLIKIKQCESDVNAIQNIGKENSANLSKLKTAINDLKLRIEEQEQFVQDYLSKNVEMRKNMFVTKRKG